MRRTTLLALPAVALVLTACSAGTPAETPAATQAPAATTAAAPSSAPASAAPAASASAAAPANADERNAGALAAIATAAADVNGTAYGIDDSDDDGTWEVDVLVGERTHELRVSSDGATVAQREEDDADRDDIDAVAAATVTLEQAIETALAEVPGTLDDVELDQDNNAVVWEVTIDEADTEDVEVYINAADGSVVRVDR